MSDDEKDVWQFMFWILFGGAAGAAFFGLSILLVTL
jgi:hypothetical protein